MLGNSYSRKDTFYMKMYVTVKPRYNEPLYNEVLGLRNYSLTLELAKYMAI